MSSGLYRPRRLDDGIVLPRVFVPRWAKASPSAADTVTSGDKVKHHAGHKHHRHIKHKSGSSIESAGDEDKSLIPKNECLPIMQKFDLRRSKKLGTSHSEDDGGQTRAPYHNHRVPKIRQQHSVLECSPIPIDATQNLISRFPSGNEISRQKNRVHGDISEVSSSSSTPPETPIKSVAYTVDPDIPCLPNDNIQTLPKHREEENASKSSLFGLPEESSEPPMDVNISLEKFGRRPDINIPSPRSSRLPTVRPCDVQIVIEHASDCHSSSPSPPPITVPQRFVTSPPTPLWLRLFWLRHVQLPNLSTSFHDIIQGRRNFCFHFLASKAGLLDRLLLKMEARKVQVIVIFYFFFFLLIIIIIIIEIFIMTAQLP